MDVLQLIELPLSFALWQFLHTLLLTAVIVDVVRTLPANVVLLFLSSHYISDLLLTFALLNCTSSLTQC